MMTSRWQGDSITDEDGDDKNIDRDRWCHGDGRDDEKGDNDEWMMIVELMIIVMMMMMKVENAGDENAGDENVGDAGYRWYTVACLPSAF